MASRGIKALWQTAFFNRDAVCTLCPHYCHLSPGDYGKCGVRQNIDGVIYAINYSKVTSLSIDPIEKKPLYRFQSGTDTLSIGSIGCNLKCKFCQNFEISQRNAETFDMSPEEVIAEAIKLNLKTIAFTYNEPVIWYEFVLDTAKLAKDAGLFVVLNTNGYINARPLKVLLHYIDAVNIDIKSWYNGFYKDLCEATVKPVLKSAIIANEMCHVEISCLIIEKEYDLDDDFKILATWIKDNLGVNTPVHLAAYRPAYKMTNEPTSIETIIRARNIFSKELDSVYYSMIQQRGENETEKEIRI